MRRMSHGTPALVSIEASARDLRASRGTLDVKMVNFVPSPTTPQLILPVDAPAVTLSSVVAGVAAAVPPVAAGVAAAGVPPEAAGVAAPAAAGAAVAGSTGGGCGSG